MAYYVKNADTFGRIGTGIGQGLAEQLPKEMERNRLASGLEQLGKQKGLTPFQQFTGLVRAAHEYPQVVQSGGDFLRQQAILDSVDRGKSPASPTPSRMPVNEGQQQGLKTATRPESTQAALNIYVPPSGQEQENMAREKMAREPQVYPNIESARQGVQNEILGNTQQSNAKIAQGELEEKVQGKAEGKLQEEIATLGANVPGKAVSRLQQKAVNDVSTGKLSPDQAKVKYGKEADKMSRVFANVASWGGISLMLNNKKDLIQAMEGAREAAKEGGYRKELADSMIADNKVTPKFAYATAYPVNEIKPLNDVLKSLPDIKPRMEKRVGAPGLAGLGISRPSGADPMKQTKDIAPALAEAMGLEGSPLSIMHELDKKGYDSSVFKQFLLDNMENLNMSSDQKDELQKTDPSFFGQLHDLWLQSFSGVK